MGDDDYFTEDTAYDPSSPYSASKASSDHLVRAWSRTFGLPILITNCSNNYGPYQFPEKLIPTAIISLLNRKSIPIYGNGKNVREWIHVQDYCCALEKIMKQGKIGQNYNVGSGFRLTNIDLSKMIYKSFQKQNVKKKFAFRTLILLTN